jgi:anti-anti-sigma regulatory factor
MSLEITCKDTQGIAVLNLVGRLTFGNDVLVFRMVFDGLMDEGHVRMALNLNRLSELDITGMNTLLYASSELQKAQGDLALFGLRASLLDPRVEEKLDALRIFATEQDAIDSFAPPDGIRPYDVLELVRSMKREREHSQV